MQIKWFKKKHYCHRGELNNKNRAQSTHQEKALSLLQRECFRTLYKNRYAAAGV